MKLYGSHIIIVGLTAALSANVTNVPRFVFEGGVGAPGSELFILPDVATELTLSLANDGDGEFPGGGIVFFDFSDIATTAGDGVSFVSWDWIFPSADDFSFWGIVGFPNPQAAGKIGPLPVAPNGQQELATFLLIADSNDLSIGESFELTLGDPTSILADGGFASIPVTDSSERVTINVVPEPAVVVMLGIGFVMLRRRRKELR